ncbi:MAG: response regulator [Aliihoeflea sp.]
MNDHGNELKDIGVFVVEDEALVALNLEDMLADLGCRVIGPAMRLGRAIEFLETAPTPDIAILDVNLAGEPVFELAERVASRGILIVFATGYGRAGLPESWHCWPILQKPYTMEDVAGSLKAALGASVKA